MDSTEGNKPRGKHAAHAKPAQRPEAQQQRRQRQAQAQPTQQPQQVQSQAAQQRNPYEGIHRAPEANPSSHNVRASVYEPISETAPTQVIPAAYGQKARTQQRAAAQQRAQAQQRAGAQRSTQRLANGQQRAGAQRTTQRLAGAQPGMQGAQAQPPVTVRSIDVGPARPKKRHRVLKVILAILAIVVVALVAFGVWFTHTLDNALEGKGRDAIASNVLEPAAAGKAFYVLVLGSDSREGSGTSEHESESGDNERSDVMMLLRIDPDRHILTMVSIPRDTPYLLPSGDLVKINEAYNIGGAAQSIEAVNALTGVRVSHFVTIHFSELQEIVDALGGVTVNVPIELSYEDALTGATVTIEPGERTLDGQQAQIFARARQEYESAQDANRQNAVRTLGIAIIKKALDRPLTDIPGTIINLAEHVGTDMRSGDLVSLATSFGLSLNDMTVYTGSGPTDGDINEAAGGKWLCYYNPEGWKSLMQVVDAGGNPEGMTFDETSIPW